MIKANQTLAVLTLVLSVSVFQNCLGIPLADNRERKPQFIYKTIGNRELKVAILYPDDWKSTDRRAAIVFFSGGAFRSGGTGQFILQAGYFSKRGMVTVRAEYRDRTKDKVKPNICLKDAISAMRWVRKNADRLGVDSERIASSGGSAGGYLAVAVATINDYHSPDDDLSVSPKPNAMVLFNPVVGFTTSRFGLNPKLAARISPLQHVEKGLPPTLIMIGTKDQFLNQNREFISKAKEVGVQVELDLADGQPHAYFNRSPWMEKTVSRADKFLVSLGYLTIEPRVKVPSPKKKSR